VTRSFAWFEGLGSDSLHGGLIETLMHSQNKGGGARNEQSVVTSILAGSVASSGFTVGFGIQKSTPTGVLLGTAVATPAKFTLACMRLSANCATWIAVNVFAFLTKTIPRISPVLFAARIVVNIRKGCD
jgi:hypothetical protein